MLELEPIRIARNRAIHIPAHKGSADLVFALFSPPYSVRHPWRIFFQMEPHQPYLDRERGEKIAPEIRRRNWIWETDTFS